MGFEQIWIMVSSADFTWFQLIFNGFQINLQLTFNWFQLILNWFSFWTFKKSIKKKLFISTDFNLHSILFNWFSFWNLQSISWKEQISTDFNWLSNGVPIETFKKSIEKKWFQLISICFQLMFLLRLQEINWQERISTDFNILTSI